MATQSRQQQGGLSIQTLAIASVASAAAAIVVHEVWRGGAILGAAITPVIVAIVSESLRRPADRVAARREQRRSSTTGQRVEEDRFGIWEADRSPRRRLNARHLKIALTTGALAFVIGAFALTATELVFGGNVGSGARDTTIVGGGSDDEEKTTTTQTQPTEEEPAPTTPEETTTTATEPPPTTTAPLPEGATPPTTQEPPPTAPQTTPGEPPAAPPPGVEPAPAEPAP